MSVVTPVREVEWLARELVRLEGATIAQAVRRALRQRPFGPYDGQDCRLREVEARLAATAALPVRDADADSVAGRAEEPPEIQAAKARLRPAQS